MKKRLVTILATLSLVFGIVAAPAVQADSRCGGKYGITIYEHTNYNRDIPGAKITFCETTPPGGWISVSNLSNYTSGLSWGANWNDRLSSYQVFNATSSRMIKLYVNSGFNSGDGVITTTGPGNIPDISRIGGKYNDSISSIKYIP